MSVSWPAAAGQVQIWDATPLGGKSVLMQAADLLQEPIQKDKEMLQGAWIVESGQMAGQVISDEDKQKWKVIFDGDKITFEEVPYPGFTLYPEESPKAIDIWTMDLPLKAIYKLEQGKLHLCTGDTTERPREFQTGAQDQFLYLILKREKR